MNSDKKAEERISEVLASTRGDGTIVVPGGAKARPLPPAAPEPGTIDPETERAIAEGKTRYHLDTLRALEEETSSAPKDFAAELVESGPRLPFARRPISVLGLASLAAFVATIGLPLPSEPEKKSEEGDSDHPFDQAMRSALLGPEEELPKGEANAELSAEAIKKISALEEERLRKEGERLAREFLGRGGDEDASPRVDVERELARGCRSAGCRTLGDCLCACRKCRLACASRKKR